MAGQYLVHLIVCVHIHACTRSGILGKRQLFTHSTIYTRQVIRSLVSSYVHMFICLFIHVWFICSFVHSFIHSFVHSLYVLLFFVVVVVLVLWILQSFFLVVFCVTDNCFTLIFMWSFSFLLSCYSAVSCITLKLSFYHFSSFFLLPILGQVTSVCFSDPGDQVIFGGLENTIKVCVTTSCNYSGGIKLVVISVINSSTI